MAGSTRRLRSHTPAEPPPAAPPALIEPIVTFKAGSTSSPLQKVNIISPGSRLPNLNAVELSLLRRKQAKLSRTAPSTLQSFTAKPRLVNALNSALIFAQHEAGSAVCIDSAGWILTCSHCFGESKAGYKADTKRRWLLYYTGLAVQVECRFWDPRRDVALLKIIAIECKPSDSGDIPVFPSVRLGSQSLNPRVPIICIGQPESEDLESETVRRTKYDLVEVSEGVFRGLVRNADPQDNSEIGTLMHDAWTYWGHSGAPLLKKADGTLVGLHSSWDSETGMRQGISIEAIREFLWQYLPRTVGADGCTSAARSGRGPSRKSCTSNDSSQAKLLPDPLSKTTELSLGFDKDTRQSVIVVSDDDD